MKRWIKKNFYFNELNNMLLYTILGYMISAIVTYIANRNGVVNINVFREFQFSIDSIIFAPTIPFVILYLFLQFATPAFLGFWIFFEYYKSFSTMEKIKGIIPVSNKRKIMNIVISTVLFYVGYLVITYITNFSIGSKTNNLIYEVILFLTTSLCAIVVDILCRENKLREVLNFILVIVSAVICFNLWNFLIVNIIGKRLDNVWSSSIILLVAWSVVEFIYILKKIDNIKIN